MKKLICGSNSPTPSSKEGEQEATLQFPPLASRKNLHEMIYVASNENLCEIILLFEKRNGSSIFFGAVKVEQHQTYIYLQIAPDTFAE